MASSSQNCTLSNATIPLTDLEWSSTEQFSIQVILPSLMVTADLANFAFIYTVVTIPRMHNVANLYLVNLAITDMLFVSQATISYWASFFGSSIRSNSFRTQVACWIVYLPSVLFYYVSLGTTLLVSLERYYAVCQPLKHRAFSKLARGKVDIIITWLLGIILAVPCALKWGDIVTVNVCTQKLDANDIPTPYVQTLYACEINLHQFIINLVSETIPSVLFVVALTTSSVFYFKILKALNAHSKISLKSSKTHVSKVKNQVARVLILNGVIFFLCQFPYRLYSIHQILSDTQVWSLQENSLELLTIFSRLCLYINSTINPFVYGAGSRFYRNAFLEAFGLSHTKESYSSESSGSGTSTIRQ